MTEIENVRKSLEAAGYRQQDIDTLIRDNYTSTSTYQRHACAKCRRKFYCDDMVAGCHEVIYASGYVACHDWVCGSCVRDIVVRNESYRKLAARYWGTSVLARLRDIHAAELEAPLVSLLDVLRGIE